MARPTSNLGGIIRQGRKHLRLTQHQLAVVLKVSQTRVSQFEHGTVAPNEQECAALSALLGRSLREADLLAEAGQKHEAADG